MPKQVLYMRSTVKYYSFWPTFDHGSFTPYGTGYLHEIFMYNVDHKSGEASVHVILVFDIKYETK